MEKYIVRRPIINNNTQKIEFYEILMRQDSSSLFSQNYSSESVIVSFFAQANVDEFLEGKDAFLTFTPELLMQDLPFVFNGEKLVIEVEDTVLLHPKTIEKLKEYKAQGYRMALVGFEFYNRFIDFLPVVDYIKIDFSKMATNKKEIMNVVKLAKKMDKKTIAYNVNSPDDRGRAIVFGFDYIQGESIEDMSRKKKTAQPKKLQSTFYRLLIAINSPEPDYNEIEKLIAMDVSVTYAMLNMINSAYFALPNRVKTVKQALTILGIQQLKRWVYLMSFVPDGGIKEELVKVSFLRATFCQNLSKSVPKFAISEDDAYMLGMFSTLGILLDTSQEDAVASLPISEHIKDGLVGKDGTCADLVNLCVAYEKAQWTKMGEYAKRLNIPTHIIASQYFDAIEHVGEMWKSVLKS